MEKLNNNKKPTRRQIKHTKRKISESDNIIIMCAFLEKKWNNTVNFSCQNCLKEAYKSELNDEQGYITDEELMKSSNYTLKYK